MRIFWDPPSRNKTKTISNPKVFLNNEIADVQWNSENLIRTCGILEKEFVECAAEAERKQDVKTLRQMYWKENKGFWYLTREKKFIEIFSRFVSYW